MYFKSEWGEDANVAVYKTPGLDGLLAPAWNDDVTLSVKRLNKYTFLGCFALKAT